MISSDKQTIRKFRELLRRFEREIFILTSESCCEGVTLAQCHTILEIEYKKEETVSELAKSLGLDKSTISRTIDGLVNIGLVDRSIPKENRRISTLTLTDSGKKVCQSINKNSDKYYNQLLSILTEKERNDFILIFEKLTNQMATIRTECEIQNKK